MTFGFWSTELWHQLFPSIPMLILLSVGVLIAGTIRAFTGFGGGLVLAPLLSLFMPPADMVVVVLLLNFLTSAQSVPSTWRTTDWQMVFSLSIPALFGVPLGVLLIEWLDANLIRRLIGVIVASLALLMLIGWKYQGRRGKVQDCVVGVTSGALTAIAGVGGPPLVLYLLSAKDISPVVLRSFFMMFFCFAQLATLVYFLFQGMINQSHVIDSITFVPVYLVSTVLGTYLFKKAVKGSVEIIKRFTLWFLLVVGLATLAF